MYHWTARRDFQNRNAERDARVRELEREHEAAATKNEALAQQLESAGATERELRAEAARQEQELAAFRKQEQERRNPTLGKPTCSDSDAKLGEGALYVRGYAEVGGGRVFDHCRLDQLVEFRCLENPGGERALHQRCEDDRLPRGVPPRQRRVPALIADQEAR